MMHNLLSEESGIKYTVGGFVTWFVSRVNEIDVTQMLGFCALVVGLVIQIASHIRGIKADARAREADDRAKIEHDLQVELLKKQIAGDE